MGDVLCALDANEEAVGDGDIGLEGIFWGDRIPDVLVLVDVLIQPGDLGRAEGSRGSYGADELEDI